MTTSAHIMIFTRYPRPGTTKTRLVPVLGPEGAARLQRRMTEHIVAEALALAEERALAVSVHYEGGHRRHMARWLGYEVMLRPQVSGDLGRRMDSAFHWLFAQGAQRGILVGSDIPGLDRGILAQALDHLDDRDLVLGPARDGGYYLVGMGRSVPAYRRRSLFASMPWGTRRVLDLTLTAASRAGLSFKLLPQLDDLDRPADLAHFKGDSLPGTPDAAERISVVIPALNEAVVIAATIRRAAAGRNTEVIVVDGGSRDATTATARETGARVMLSPAGRSRQMNAGAAAACGDLLLFLHADTRLPPDWETTVRRALAKAEVAAGAFRLGIDAQSAAVRFIERVANFRSQVLQLPYGDQGLFLRRSLFQGIGGFADIPIMEDFDLVRRLRRKGRIVTVNQAVTTSARRWMRLGVLRTWLINQAVVMAFYAGLPPARIAAWYRAGTDPAAAVTRTASGRR